MTTLPVGRPTDDEEEREQHQRSEHRRRRRHRPGRRGRAPPARGARLPGRRDPLLRLGALAPARRCRGRARTSSSRTPRRPTRRGLDIAIFSAGATALEGAGARASPPPASLVIDNSSGWRMDPDVPLVVSEVNPHAIDEAAQGHHRQPELHHHGGHARAQGAARRGRPRAPHRRAPTRPCPAPVSPAARSCSSRRGPRSRRTRSGSCTTARAVDVPRRRTKFPRTIAFDVIPLAGSIVDDGDSRPTRRRSSATRAARSSSCPACWSSGTCVRVPVFTGHSLVDQRRVRRPDHARARDRAAGGRPGRRARPTCPTPLEAAGNDPSYVGRIRQDEGVPDGRGLALFISNDNLRKGAALNAVQIAELVAAKLPAAV